MTLPDRQSPGLAGSLVSKNGRFMAAQNAKVLIVVRSDAAQKNGGDYQMMQAFERELATEFKTERCYGVPSDADLTCVSAVLCTNLDRPIEAYKTLRACQHRSIPFLLYTLHHPHAGIEAYLRQGTRGSKRKIATLAGFDPQRYEQLLWALRGAVTLAKSRRLLPQMSVAGAQVALLQDADRVICCADSEVATLAKDIVAPTATHVVPHPADAPAVTGVTPVAGRIVVAGRIEARKNQIGALKMAASLPDFEFVFVGAPVPSEKQYFQEFEALLKATPNADYKPALPKEEFYPFLASAEIVLNPSFFEVTSLIDVYCVTNGIPLVTTDHTYLQGDGCFRKFSPADVVSGVAAIQDCAQEIAQGGRLVTLAPEPNAVDMIDVVRGVL